MMLKLGLFLFLTLLLRSIKCSSCPPGYISISFPCDTRSTLLQLGEYTTSRQIWGGKWEYYFLPLNGAEEKIEIEIERWGGVNNGFFQIRSADLSQLPPALSDEEYLNEYHFEFEFEERVKSFQIPISKRRGSQALLIGVNNPQSNVRQYSGAKIRCALPKEDVIEADQKSSFSWKAFFVISGASVAILTVGLRYVKKNRPQRLVHREPAPARENQQNVEVQPPLLPNIEVPQSDRLNQKELEEYFPKMPFGTLENPFQQSACPFCLEEFALGTVCCQLYCHHIFHDYCAQAWLSEKNDCPACRGPVTREAIKEFLEAKAFEA